MAADTIAAHPAPGIDAQGKAEGFGTFVPRRIVGASGQKVVAVAQRGRRRKLPAPVRADQRLTYGIAVIVKDDCVACGAATAQPGLGFLGNLIGINRISVAVSYADNAGGGRAWVSMVIVKSVEKGVVLPLLSLAVTVKV